MDIMWTAVFLRVAERQSSLECHCPVHGANDNGALARGSCPGSRLQKTSSSRNNDASGLLVKEEEEVVVLVEVMGGD